MGVQNGGTLYTKVQFRSLLKLEVYVLVNWCPVIDSIQKRVGSFMAIVDLIFSLPEGK